MKRHRARGAVLDERRPLDGEIVHTTGDPPTSTTVPLAVAPVNTYSLPPSIATCPPVNTIVPIACPPLLTMARHREQTISAMAYLCSFGDLSCFDRALRRVFGNPYRSSRDRPRPALTGRPATQVA
jgi:hypothetical protein